MFVILGATFALAAVGSISIPTAVLLLLSLIIATTICLYARSGPLAKVGQAAVATFGTLFGVLQAIRGRTVTTWAPAKSR